MKIILDPVPRAKQSLPLNWSLSTRVRVERTPGVKTRSTAPSDGKRHPDLVACHVIAIKTKWRPNSRCRCGSVLQQFEHEAHHL